MFEIEANQVSLLNYAKEEIPMSKIEKTSTKKDTPTKYIKPQVISADMAADNIEMITMAAGLAAAAAVIKKVKNYHVSDSAPTISDYQD